MLATRSLLFNALFYLNLVVLMIIGLPTMLFGRRAVFALARLWGAISVWLLETICGLKLEYRGVENIPPGECAHQKDRSEARAKKAIAARPPIKAPRHPNRRKWA